MKIYISDNSFSYDLHSLTKAFFPYDDVLVEKIEIDESKANGFTYRYLLDDNIGDRECNGEIFVEESKEERPVYKNRIKRAVYELLSNDTNKKLPWGTLTGIRPTKLPMSKLIEGKKAADFDSKALDKEIISFLHD